MRRVSAVITTYNQEQYIEATVASVLRQSHPCTEVIVVDDGSTDGTPDRVNAFGKAVISIRQKNTGVAGSRNTGVRRATGDLVAFLDGDDLWAPEKVAAQVEAFERYPSSGLIAVDVCHFSEENTLWSGFLADRLFRSDTAPLWSGHIFEKLVEGNFISTTSQVAIPKHVLDTVGYSDTSFPIASDYDLYLRIGASYPLTFINRVLTSWRYVAASVSGRADRRQLRWNEDTLAVLQKHLRTSTNEHRSVIGRRRAALLRETAGRAYYHGREGDREWATQYLLKLARKHRHPAALLSAMYLWAPPPVRSAGKRVLALMPHRRPLPPPMQ